MNLFGVGSRLMNLVVIASVAGLILFGLIQYGQSIERQNQAEDELRENVETRGRIDESIRDTRDIDPRNALERLRERQTQ